MSREAMQMALEALELLAKYENPSTKIQVRKPKDGGSIVTMYPHKVATEAAALLRERLAQPEQEPVATVTSESGNPNLSMSWWHEPALPVGTKIYTSPQPNKQWVGLTDQELKEMHNEIKVRLMGTYRTEDIYRSIEATKTLEILRKERERIAAAIRARGNE